ncbi:hypothetical protein H5410_006259 [Solanum commersonii]|uniref:Uncharacterized protein n=1 Tax=Solanum commersonii TaxID=4109 RepID=A0A9J6A980_SOLCO|nr:hypothetical protein H5410_006259 [Solanum commersonii]
MDYSRDDFDGLLNDQFRDVAQAEGVYDGPNEDAKKFYNLVEEESQELYPGCTGFSKLSFTLRLYLLKSVHGWSNESFTSFLERAQNNDECEPSDAEIVHAYLLGNCDEVQEYIRDLFNIGDQVESNLLQSYENEPFEHLMGSSIPKDNGEVLLTRIDVPEIIINVPSEEFVTQQLEVEEEEFKDESENEYEDEFEDELEDESEEEMNQSAILKKKGSNPNKAQSPLKNLDFNMQYRSSAELANKFKIKREQLAKERNDRAKKDQAPIPHKRKNSEDFIPQQ